MSSAQKDIKKDICIFFQVKRDNELKQGFTYY